MTSAYLPRSPVHVNGFTYAICCIVLSRAGVSGPLFNCMVVIFEVAFCNGLNLQCFALPFRYFAGGPDIKPRDMTIRVLHMHPPLVSWQTGITNPGIGGLGTLQL
jgi:hypothetical protein